MAEDSRIDDIDKAYRNLDQKDRRDHLPDGHNKENGRVQSTIVDAIEANMFTREQLEHEVNRVDPNQEMSTTQVAEQIMKDSLERLDLLASAEAISQLGEDAPFHKLETMKNKVISDYYEGSITIPALDDRHANDLDYAANIMHERETLAAYEKMDQNMRRDRIEDGKNLDNIEVQMDIIDAVKANSYDRETLQNEMARIDPEGKMSATDIAVHLMNDTLERLDALATEEAKARIDIGIEKELEELKREIVGEYWEGKVTIGALEERHGAAIDERTADAKQQTQEAFIDDLLLNLDNVSTHAHEAKQAKQQQEEKPMAATPEEAKPEVDPKIKAQEEEKFIDDLLLNLDNVSTHAHAAKQAKEQQEAKQAEAAQDPQAEAQGTSAPIQEEPTVQRRRSSGGNIDPKDIEMAKQLLKEAGLQEEKPQAPEKEQQAQGRDSVADRANKLLEDLESLDPNRGQGPDAKPGPRATPDGADQTRSR